MELSEEKELNRVTEEFAKGVEAFKKQDLQQALDIFNNLVKKYEDSEYYSVLEIQARSKVYLSICQSRLTPVEVELKDDEDHLQDGVYHLNAGNLDKANERFDYLSKKGFDNPYLDYLMALLFLKKEDADTCLKHLKAAIKKDSTYNVIAHNEPDFEPLFENEEFVALMDDE